MADDTVAEVKVAPRALYYVAIDGTPARDSAAFGAMIEAKFGWRNLLSEFLPRVEDQPTGIAGDEDRLIDAAHPYLSVGVHKTSHGGGRTVAVVEPGGRDGKGQDPFLQSYSGEKPAEKPHGKFAFKDGLGRTHTTFGRHSALEKSARFMKRFVLNPAVEIDPGGTPSARLHDTHPDLIFPFPQFLRRAELLLVSSHGWLGGYMRGDHAPESPSAVPADAQAAFGPRSTYFSVGEAATQGHGFRGPLWIILAQCSTVNSATWPLWVKVFARSQPIVRGVLAYEEASPGPAGSITISKRFFGHLRRGETFVEAWKKANSNQKWAAIVHQDALGDRIQDWRSFEPLTEAATTATSGSYRGFLRTIPHGEEIVEKAPPFELGAKIMLTAGDKEIGPATLDTLAVLRATAFYSFVVAPAGGQRLTAATIEWIHIRDTHPHQFPFRSMFSRVDNLPSDEEIEAVLPSGTGRVLEIKSTTGPRTELRFVIQAVDDATLIASGLESSHSYLWIRASIKLDDGSSLSHDFKTIGLSYY